MARQGGVVQGAVGGLDAPHGRRRTGRAVRPAQEREGVVAVCAIPPPALFSRLLPRRDPVARQAGPALPIWRRTGRAVRPAQEREGVVAVCAIPPPALFSRLLPRRDPVARQAGPAIPCATRPRG